ncbi:MAG TPA: tripartite tricarboxylate transporter substrate-binding protein [Chloroflexota bacterium]|nr:tripartite tricarboxylate transporter substrate-binding protein [Chloroflexota bacterium]
MQPIIRSIASSPLAFMVLLCAAVACSPRSGSMGAAPAPEVSALSPSDFYAGKTLTIIVGYGPGGGFDQVARLLARHLPDHLAGSPTVVVQNMDGAGSLVAANFLYNAAKPDGLTIGTFNEQQVLNQITAADGVQFDARKFSWIGSALGNTPICSVRADSPYKTAADLLRHDLPPDLAARLAEIRR